MNLSVLSLVLAVMVVKGQEPRELSQGDVNATFDLSSIQLGAEISISYTANTFSPRATLESFSILLLWTKAFGGQKIHPGNTFNLAELQPGRSSIIVFRGERGF